MRSICYCYRVSNEKPLLNNLRQYVFSHDVCCRRQYGRCCLIALISCVRALISSPELGVRRAVQPTSKKYTNNCTKGAAHPQRSNGGGGGGRRIKTILARTCGCQVPEPTICKKTHTTIIIYRRGKGVR